MDKLIEVLGMILGIVCAIGFSCVLIIPNINIRTAKRKELDQLQYDKQKAEQELAAAQAREKESEYRCELLRAEVKEIRTQRQKVDKELISLQNELKEAKKTCADATRERDVIKINYTNLKDEYQELKNSHSKLKSEQGELKQNYSDLQSEYEDLQNDCLDIDEQQKIISVRKYDLIQKEQKIQEQDRNLSIRLRKLCDYESKLYNLQLKLYDQLSAAKARTFINGFDGNFTIEDPLSLGEITIRSGINLYQTSLNRCSCEAFTKGHVSPCKHMIWLEDLYCHPKIRSEEQEAILNELKEEIKKADQQIETARKEKSSLKALEKKLNIKETALNEKIISYPWFANMMTNYEEKLDKICLESLPQNATAARETVSKIKKEKKTLLSENTILKNKMFVYQSTFPWLDLVDKITPDQAKRLSKHLDYDEDYITFLRRHLTPEEFVKMSPEEKLLVALDRCQKEPSRSGRQ